MTAGLSPLVLPETLARYVQRESDRLGSNYQEQIPAYREHFVRIQCAVGEAIKGLKGTALIVGVGAAHDIPLRELAGTFDRIRLVDIELRHTREAVEKQIPEELRGKFELEQADLSGVMPELCENAEKWIAQKLQYEEFIKNILDLLPKLKARSYAYQQKQYTFVCSALTSSQIAGTLFGYLNDLTEEHYGLPFESPKDRSGELDQFMGTLQVAHLQDLHQRAAERIYFADHFSVKGIVILESARKTDSQEAWEVKFPEASKMRRTVRQLFEVISQQKWSWILQMKTTTQEVRWEQPGGSTRKEKTRVRELLEYQITSYVIRSSQRR